MTMDTSLAIICSIQFECSAFAIIGILVGWRPEDDENKHHALRSVLAGGWHVAGGVGQVSCLFASFFTFMASYGQNFPLLNELWGVVALPGPIQRSGENAMLIKNSSDGRSHHTLASSIYLDNGSESPK
ncbi:hypothetical protein DEU56DRAFT_834305 [Suillus clintonianus]|uniref:uncharacterized protein n=1 Tax=Suillus clintonianus TaxID=1904413 RepID=UPI001B860268|nr:uncharacterized protein DEU56DRAFT_834305 [Suillus clintonianus]KAG2121451.1 hypothetical protein DEU56DRAFT_834305 [Suillus clintonianus]